MPVDYCSSSPSSPAPGWWALLCYLALLTNYHNLKRAYNHPRLVELSEGKAMRLFYEKSDAFFTLLGDPAKEAQKSGGMTWSIRVGGIPSPIRWQRCRFS